MGVLWKVLGLLFAIIGVVLPFAPGLLGVSGMGVHLAFLGGALAFIAIGIVFLRTTPPSGILRCPSCGHEAKPRRSFYYCPECGHTLLTDNDELKPSEINCPFCDEPISKGTGICPRCSKTCPASESKSPAKDHVADGAKHRWWKGRNSAGIARPRCGAGKAIEEPGRIRRPPNSQRQ